MRSHIFHVTTNTDQQRHPMATSDNYSDPQTLAQLRQQILADATLPEARRKAMASALNTVERALGQPLESLPADPTQLRPMLERVTPAMVRLSTGSWKNVRSLLGAVLRHANRNMLPQRFDIAPSPAWGELLGLVRGTRHLFHLGRFARYATQADIEPDEVNDAVLARYTQLLVTQSLGSAPLRCGRDTILSWNAARERFPQWPQQTLTVPDNRIRRSLDWGKYPATLQAEVEGWIAWLGGDLFLDRDFRPLKPLSLQSRKRYLSLYLGELVADGVNPATMTELAPLVAPAMAKRALSRVHRRQGDRTSLHLSAMAGVVLMIARHWAKLPADEIEKLRRLSKTLRPETQGLTPRNERRLALLMDPRQQELLINLPARLAERVRKGGRPTQHLARIMQTAVAVDVLLSAALRISNLAGLSIGKTLLVHHDGRMSIAIPADQVKNSVPLTADLPPTATALVREYIRLYRPLLGDASGPWLFPGAKPGTQKTTGALRDQISGAIAREYGLEMHPHLFRHFLAAMVLAANPGNDGLVTRALGHKRQDTTRSHYVGFQTQHALKHYDALIERRRTQSIISAGGR
nr:tyrosine-type recombinase/integrase [Roseococcus sp. MDT2-1-1]